jgi:hypothetical protein
MGIFGTIKSVVLFIFLLNVDSASSEYTSISQQEIHWLLLLETTYNTDFMLSHIKETFVVQS